MMFTEYLRTNCPEYDSDEWIIKGIRREKFAKKRDYAGALRVYDPELFYRLKKEFESQYKRSNEPISNNKTKNENS